MKLITFTVPCYNSAAYMDRCIETLLPAGEEAEIILVDDGSTDETGRIADEYAAKYPTIVRVIHQENGGHGEGVNQGIRNAQGFTSRWWTLTTGWTAKHWPCHGQTARVCRYGKAGGSAAVQLCV